MHRHRFSRIRVVCRAADKTEGKVMSMMLWERAAKICLRRTATISKQHGFMQRKSTVDVMFALRWRVIEKVRRSSTESVWIWRKLRVLRAVARHDVGKVA